LSLKITGLSKTYPNGVKALKDLTLTIGNHMFGLLGTQWSRQEHFDANSRHLAGPDSGTVQLDDLNVLTQKDEVRKVLGYLPQEFGVYPRMSALDMLHHLAILTARLAYSPARLQYRARNSFLGHSHSHGWTGHQQWPLRRPRGRSKRLARHLPNAPVG
jgi:ABC-type Na+ transport system ATPase subunit NatA